MNAIIRTSGDASASSRRALSPSQVIGGVSHVGQKRCAGLLLTPFAVAIDNPFGRSHAGKFDVAARAASGSSGRVRLHSRREINFNALDKPTPRYCVNGWFEPKFS